MFLLAAALGSHGHRCHDTPPAPSFADFPSGYSCMKKTTSSNPYPKTTIRYPSAGLSYQSDRQGSASYFPGVAVHQTQLRLLPVPRSRSRHLQKTMMKQEEKKKKKKKKKKTTAPARSLAIHVHGRIRPTSAGLGAEPDAISDIQPGLPSSACRNVNAVVCVTPPDPYPMVFGPKEQPHRRPSRIQRPSCPCRCCWKVSTASQKL